MASFPCLLTVFVLTILLDRTSCRPTACYTSDAVCDCSPQSDYQTTDVYVICNRKGNGLTLLPTGVPASTTKYKLSHNSIASLNAEYLDLPKLKQLEINNNALERIGSTEFSKLPKLEKLNLEGNIISSIAPDAFVQNRKLREIRLDGNPLNCDCKIYEFRKWVKTTEVTIRGAKCANLLWKDLFKVKPSEFKGNCVASPTTSAPTKAPVITTHKVTTIPATRPPVTTKRPTQRPVTGKLPKPTIVTERKFCSHSLMVTLKGNFTWQKTREGTTTYFDCPVKQGNKASRKCARQKSGEPRWNKPDLGPCTYLSKTTQFLQKLANEKVTKANVVDVSQRLAKLSTNSVSFSYMDVSLASRTIGNIVKSGEAFTTAGTQEKTAESLVTTISNMMEAGHEELRQAELLQGECVTKLIKYVDEISKSLQLYASNKTSYVQDNLAVAVVDSKQAFEGDVALVLLQMGNDQGLSKNKVQVGTGGPATNSKPDTSLIIPKEVAQKYPNEKTSFALYRKDKFFRAMDGTQQNSNKARTNSRIVAASIGDQVIKNLQKPVKIYFGYLDKKSYTNPKCVYWDFTKTDWSSEGCQLVKKEGEGAACECNHLTNFALLMDLTGDVAQLDDTQFLIQTILTYAGCSLSILALLITLFTYFYFKRELLRDNPAKILVNLCFSLIITNLIFICGSHYKIDDVGCKIIAVMLHYSILANFSWMCVEAFYMYLALIKVFQPYWSRLIIKMALFGWGFPIIPVAITIGINRDNYGFQGICWLRPVPLYAAFLTPICFMLLFNFIIFGMVVWRLYENTKTAILARTDKKSTKTQLRGTASVVVLLGLTWVFGLMNINGAAVVFSYLFIVFNTLQGVFIFVFYCLWKRQARHVWMRKCGCRMAPEDKYPTNGTSKSIGSATKSTSALKRTSNGRTPKLSTSSNVSDLSFSSGNDAADLIPYYQMQNLNSPMPFRNI